MDPLLLAFAQRLGLAPEAARPALDAVVADLRAAFEREGEVRIATIGTLRRGGDAFEADPLLLSAVNLAYAGLAPVAGPTPAPPVAEPAEPPDALAWAYAPADPETPDSGTPDAEAAWGDEPLEVPAVNEEPTPEEELTPDVAWASGSDPEAADLEPTAGGADVRDALAEANSDAEAEAVAETSWASDLTFEEEPQESEVGEIDERMDEQEPVLDTERPLSAPDDETAAPDLASGVATAALLGGVAAALPGAYTASSDAEPTDTEPLAFLDEEPLRELSSEYESAPDAEPPPPAAPPDDTPADESSFDTEDDPDTPSEQDQEPLLPALTDHEPSSVEALEEQSLAEGPSPDPSSGDAALGAESADLDAEVDREEPGAEEAGAEELLPEEFADGVIDADMEPEPHTGSELPGAAVEARPTTDEEWDTLLADVWTPADPPDPDHPLGPAPPIEDADYSVVSDPALDTDDTDATIPAAFDATGDGGASSGDSGSTPPSAEGDAPLVVDPLTADPVSPAGDDSAEPAFDPLADPFGDAERATGSGLPLGGAALGVAGAALAGRAAGSHVPGSPVEGAPPAPADPLPIAAPLAGASSDVGGRAPAPPRVPVAGLDTAPYRVPTPADGLRERRPAPAPQGSRRGLALPLALLLAGLLVSAAVLYLAPRIRQAVRSDDQGEARITERQDDPTSPSVAPNAPAPAVGPEADPAAGPEGGLIPSDTPLPVPDPAAGAPGATTEPGAPLAQGRPPSETGAARRAEGTPRVPEPDRSETTRSDPPSTGEADLEPVTPARALGPALRGGGTVDAAGGGVTWIVNSTSAIEARQQAQRYRAQGYRAGVVTGQVRGQTVHRVAVGQFATAEEAQRARAGLPPDAPAGAWIHRLDE